MKRSRVEKRKSARNNLVYFGQAMFMDAKPVRSMKIEGFECPFCGHEEGILVEGKIDYGTHEEGFGQDYWDCTECGAANHIFSEGDTSIFGETPFFVDSGNWAGLEGHMGLNPDMAAFNALSYARFLSQKKEFELALKITKLILAVDKNYFEAQGFAERLGHQLFYLSLKRKMKSLDIGRLMESLTDHMGHAQWYFDSKTGDILSDFDTSPGSGAEKIETGPERFIEIFPIDLQEVFKRMQEFAQMLPEEISGKLLLALKGEGSFRRFKDSLGSDEELKTDWYSHYNGLVWFRAMEWLRENAVEKV